MKRVIYAMLLLLFIGNVASSCNKEEISAQRPLTDEEMVWVTPDGYVIPATERHNWKTYVSQRFGEKAPSGYLSSACTTQDGKCGLSCASNKTDNCSNAFTCTACANCCVGEVRNPY